MPGSPAKSPGLRTEIVRVSEAAPADPVRFLIHAACTDTYHDFGGKKGFGTQVRKGDTTNPSVYDTRMGLNVPAEYAPIPQNRDHKDGGLPDTNALHDEDELMVETFRHVQLPDGTRIVNSENIIKGLITHLLGVPDGVLLGQNFDGLWDVDSTIITNNYNIKLFKTDTGKSDISKLWVKGKKTPTTSVSHADITKFFGGNDIYLVFDASVLNLMTFIKATPDSGLDLKVHRIFNRESCNDPAGHTYDDVPFNEWVTSDVYFDNDTDKIIYRRHENIIFDGSGIGCIPGEAAFKRDKLFSQYDFTLGPLDFQKSGAPRINLDLQDAKGSRVHQSADPRTDNNISNCWKRLLLCYKNDSKHINSAAHVHCKRSGDWLQALSCLDTRRMYNNTPCTAGVNRPESNNKLVEGQNLILVTHDRVLLTYALTIGIDVIMTYKWTEGNAEKEAAAAALAGDDEEGEAIDDDASTKYMIYFRNSKNDTPEQKRIALETQVAIADALYDMDKAAAPANKRITYIENYNAWVEIIRKSSRNTIDTAIAESRAATSLGALGKGLSNILKGYIRYTSMDYSLMVAEDYSVTEREFSEERKKHKDKNKELDEITLEELTELAARAALYCGQVSFVGGRKNRIKTLEDLIAANNSYKNNPMYSTPVTLTSVVLQQRGAGESSQTMLMLETVNYLMTRLPTDMYGEAIAIFTSLRGDKKAYFTGDRQYMYGLFLANLVASAPTAAAAAAALPPKTKASMEKASSEAMAEEIQLKRELAGVVPAAAVPGDEDEELQNLEDDTEDGEIAKKGLDENELVAETNDAAAAIPPSTERKKRVSSVFTHIQSAITVVGRWAFSFVVPGTGQAGGGYPAAVASSSPEENLITAEFLVKLYFRELYYTLYAFESEGNFDYDYYKTIATIAVVVAKLHPGDWLKQQAFFYDELPKMDYTDIYPSDKLVYMRYNLKLAVDSLTARSVAMPPGPVPSMGFTGIGSIPLAESLAYARQLRSLDFGEQRDTLIEACEAAVLFGSTAPVAAPPVNMAALNRNRRSRKAAANAAAAAAASRGRTLGTGELVSDPAFTMPAALTVPATPGPATLGPASLGPATLGPGLTTPSYEMVSPVMSRGGDRRQRRTKRRARRAAYSYKARAAKRYTRRG